MAGSSGAGGRRRALAGGLCRGHLLRDIRLLLWQPLNAAVAAVEGGAHSISCHHGRMRDIRLLLVQLLKVARSCGPVWAAGAQLLAARRLLQEGPS